MAFARVTLAALVSLLLWTISVTAQLAPVGSTKPSSSYSGAGVIRAASKIGRLGPKNGDQTLTDGMTLDGYIITGDVTMSGNSILVDCIVHGRVKAIGSSGSPLVYNCIIDGNGNYGANGAPANEVWLLQSTMTGTGIARFHHNTVKSRVISYTVSGIGYRNYESYRNDVSQVVDGLSVTASGSSNVRIMGDYVHDLMFVRPCPNHSDGWTHNDGIQVHSGTGTIIEGVNLEATTGPLSQGTNPYGAVVTGQAIGFTGDAGLTSSVTVRNSWVSGGAHGIIAIIGSNPSTSIGTFQNIRFGRNSKVNAMQMSSRYTGNSYSQLIYEDNGQTVPVTIGEG